MPKRRTMMLGLGALAMGSGAAFTSAAFQDSVDADSDMRVVAVEELTVQPGIAFRDGNDPDDSYQDSLDGDGSGGKFYSESNNDFFDDSSPSTGESEGLGEDLSGVQDLPAISVSNDEDGSLTIKIATQNDAGTSEFGEALQVANEGDTTREVGVKFETFGVDTDGEQDEQDGEVAEADVVDAYSFLDDSDNVISTGNTDFSSVEGQKVENTVSVSPGETEQIGVEIDLDGSLVSDIASAGTATESPFGGAQDTVQLVDTVRFGSDPADTEQEE